MERLKAPNLGLWSPAGGKLDAFSGESPYACACRESREELGLEISPNDLHLTGLVSEQGYEGATHWLMFLFEVKKKLNSLPVEHREGRFAFFKREDFDRLKMPETDREEIWPLFWRHRGGFFAAHFDCRKEGGFLSQIEESIPAYEG